MHFTIFLRPLEEAVYCIIDFKVIVKYRKIMRYNICIWGCYTFQLKFFYHIHIPNAGTKS